MKLTADNLRIAVSGNTKNGKGCAILYPVPNWKKQDVTDDKLSERMKDSNKQYQVFLDIIYLLIWKNI